MLPTLVTLSAADVQRIVDHLLRLAPEDRSLRFAAGLVTDDTIRRYGGGIRFGRDAAFGLIDAAGTVVGVAHACLYEVRGVRTIEASFSVDAAWRGQGCGSRLMRAVEAHAAAVGAAVLVGQCATKNTPMRRIFDRVGMLLTRCEDELHATRCVVPLREHADLEAEAA